MLPLVCIDDDVYVSWDERTHQPHGAAISRAKALETYGTVAVQFADAERLAEPELYNRAGPNGQLLSRAELVQKLQ